MKLSIGFLIGILSLASVVAQGMESFVIQNIRFQGLQRLSEGSVLSYLPTQVGETLDEAKAAHIIHTLFKKGMFQDVALKREGQDLVIVLKERPIISTIEITGNKKISTEDLQKGLKEMGLATSEMLNPALLNQIKKELTEQYFNFGLYRIDLQTELKELPNNQVAIKINIQEGKPARIKAIELVGNQSYRDKALLKQFQLDTGSWLSFFTKSNQYSKQKLSGDLETLRSFYLDHGYMDFQLKSTGVTLSPDKTSIYITLNIEEGPKYTVTSVLLGGERLEEEQKLLADIQELIPKNSLFSRQAITKATKLLNDTLGEKGYLFTTVHPIPDVDKHHKQVQLQFLVDRGKRVYVRRIDFSGNTKTKDEVLRRELRQAEGTFASTTEIERSKVRLERLGYFSQVTIETKPVAGSSDQVDLLFTVVEQPSGSFKAAVGFAQNEGLLFNMGLNQTNFLGTGDSVLLNFNNSKSYTSYLVEHTNPYFTKDGVSRTLKGFYRKTDAKEENISDFTKDSFGGGGGFGVPLSEHDFFRVNLEYSDNAIKLGKSSALLSEQAKGFFTAHHLNTTTDRTFEYNGVTLQASFSHDTRNRAIFPSHGIQHTLSTEVALPGNELEYYKAQYLLQHYYEVPKFFSFLKEWVAEFRGSIAYGHAYGKAGQYPFFENFFAGGINSLRGFKTNSIGPREIIINSPTEAPKFISLDEPMGGNLRILGGVELFFPMPFFSDKTSVRSSLFADLGNVLETSFKFNNTDPTVTGSVPNFDDMGAFRVSLGTAVTWLSPLGPLSFSLGFPVKKELKDETQVFQFSFGAMF
ncbi:MAG: outer membrane protein assembly factor BamA [Gammaproteobacteria bacterium]|nr:outer membrane protein assembly factor BamA [Gammaproteobacteria bacterium]